MEYSSWNSGRSHVQNRGSSRCNSPFAGVYAETHADSKRTSSTSSLLIMSFNFRLM